MVSTADQLASNAGVDALERGGSAADAMVAAAAVMAVVGPHLCGLGGDVLAMVSEPGRDPVALLSIGRAGSGVDPAALRASGHDTMPLRGDLSSAPVPGAVDGWLALHDRYGRLSREQVFARAIELAESGFTASLLLSMASHLIHGLAGAEELCPDGPVDLEATVRLPGIARTLRTIAKDGRDGFYQGEFGRELVRVGEGIYAEKDLTDSLAQWCDPLALGVWDHDLWTVPAPSQGYLTLASSFIAEHLGLGEDPSDPRWAHLVVEASRAAGHDRPAVLFDGADGVSLLDPDRLRRIAARVRDHEAAAADVDAASGESSVQCPIRRRRRHDPPLRDRRGRARHLAHPVECARLRVPRRRRFDRCLPPQSRSRLLAAGGTPRRAGTRSAASAHPLAHAGHQGRSADSSGRSHGRGRPAADPPPVAGPDAA